MNHSITQLKKQVLEYVKQRENLHSFLRQYIFQRQSRLFVISILLTLTVCCIIAIIFLIIERSAIQHELFRWLFASLFYISFIFGIVYAIKSILAKPNFTTAALEIEKHNPDYNSLLLTAAELESKENEISISPVLHKLTVVIASNKIENSHVQKAVSNEFPLHLSCMLFVFTTIIIGSWYLLSPYEVKHGLKRLYNPIISIPAYTNVTFTIEPGNIIIAKGENVVIKASTNNTISKEPLLTLISDNNGENKDNKTTVEMVKDNLASTSSNTYFYLLNNVNQNIKYQIHYQKYKSDEFTITTIDRPEIINLYAIIYHPHYISKTPEKLQNNQCDINALIGSKVELYGESSQTLASACVYFENIGSIPCSISSNTNFFISFEVSTSTFYSISLINEYGITNINPVKYKINALIDASPTVEIIKPASNVSYPKSKRLDIRIVAKDDFGITSTLLYYTTETKRNFIPLSMKPDRSPIKEYEIEYPWLLDTINIVPGTVISYYVYVEDSKQPIPNIATTTKYYVSMPSPIDRLAGLYKTQNEIINDFVKYTEQQKIRKEQLEALYQKIKHEGKIDQITENEIEQTIKELDSQIKKSQEILEKFNEVSNNLRQNPLTNPQILEKLQKINDLFNEVLDEEAKKLKEQLIKALEDIKVDPKEIEKFYNNFNIEDFVNKLDKTLDILQKVKDEMRMYSIGKAIEEIKQRQEKICSETSEIYHQQPQSNLATHSNNLTQEIKNKLNELSQQQEKIASDLQQLEEEANKILQEKPKVGNEQHPALEDVKNLVDMFKNLNYSKTTEEIKQNLNSNNLQNAIGLQKDMLKFLDSLKKHGDQICQNCMMSGSFSLKVDLTTYIKNAIKISKDQEWLLSRLENMPFQFLRGQQPELEEIIDDVSIYQSQLKNFAKNYEIALENLLKVDLLMPMDLSKKIKGTQRIFADIIKNLEDRSIGAARNQQKDIINKFNELALDLIKLQEDINSSISISNSTNTANFIEQFKELTKRQLSLYQKNMQKLNSADKNLLQDLIGMSLEQRFIRESLQQLKSDAQRQINLLGRMDDIISEMKDIETQILDPNQQRKAAERQKSVYEKMLRAQKSLKKADEENEQRKAERPSEHLKQVQTNNQLPELQKDIQDYSKDFLSDLKEDYPKSYEKHLNDYFKSLSLFGGLNDNEK